MDPSRFDQALAKFDQELKARREGLERKRRAEQDLAQVRIQKQAIEERLKAADEIGAADLSAPIRELLRGVEEEERRLVALAQSPPPPAPAPAPPPAPAPAPALSSPLAAIAAAPAPTPPPAAKADAVTEAMPAGPEGTPQGALDSGHPAPPPAAPVAPCAETRPISLPKPPEEDPAAVRETRSAAEDLVEEVDQTLPSLAVEPNELRNTRFLIWSLRWRLLRQRAERELPSAMNILSWAFARLREAQKSVAEVPFLRAFNPKEMGDWARELADAEALLAKLRLKFRPPRTRQVEVHLRRQQEQTKALKRDEEAYEALNRLKAVPVTYCLPEDPDGVRAFRDAARGCLRFAKRLGGDLRMACGPYRDLLEGEEWEVIWAVEEKAAPTPQDRERAAADAQEAKRAWTRRDLVGRMLRRMLAKKEIGGKHTEVHNLYQGLPDHVRGDAKEGVDLLIKEGILRRKPTTKDEHVSIEPSFVRVVEDLLEGRPLPQNLARWLDEAPVAR